MIYTLLAPTHTSSFTCANSTLHDGSFTDNVISQQRGPVTSTLRWYTNPHLTSYAQTNSLTTYLRSRHTTSIEGLRALYTRNKGVIPLSTHVSKDVTHTSENTRRLVTRVSLPRLRTRFQQHVSADVWPYARVRTFGGSRTVARTVQQTIRTNKTNVNVNVDQSITPTTPKPRVQLGHNQNRPRTVRGRSALLSLLTGTPVSLRCVSARGLTRFAYAHEALLAKQQSEALAKRSVQSTKGSAMSTDNVDQESTTTLSTTSSSTSIVESAIANMISSTATTSTDAFAMSKTSSTGHLSRVFLQGLRREMGSRFRGLGGELDGLLRAFFVGMYLKKPSYLLSVLARSIVSVGRSKKETVFLRFAMKRMKVFAAVRPEIYGVRISFSGRVNRWRRTKRRMGEKGTLPLFSTSARLEFGKATAITSKGALGLRLWIAYTPSFSASLRRTTHAYLTTTLANRGQRVVSTSTATVTSLKGIFLTLEIFRIYTNIHI